MSSLFQRAGYIADQIQRTSDIVGRENAMQYQARRELELVQHDRQVNEQLLLLKQRIQTADPNEVLSYFDPDAEGSDPTQAWKGFDEYDWGLSEDDPYYNEKRLIAERARNSLTPWAVEQQARARSVVTAQTLSAELPRLLEQGEDAQAQALVMQNIDAGFIPYEAGNEIYSRSLMAREKQIAYAWAEATGNADFLDVGRDIELPEGDERLSVQARARQALASLPEEARAELAQELRNVQRRDETAALEARKGQYTQASNAYQGVIYNAAKTGDFRQAYELINQAEEAGLFYEPAFKNQWIDELRRAEADYQRYLESLKSDQGANALQAFEAQSKSLLNIIDMAAKGGNGYINGRDVQGYFRENMGLMTIEDRAKAQSAIEQMQRNREADPSYAQASAYFSGAAKRFIETESGLETREAELSGYMAQVFTQLYEKAKADRPASAIAPLVPELLRQAEGLTAARYGVRQITQGGARITVPSYDAAKQQAAVAVSTPQFGSQDRQAWAAIESVAKNGGLMAGIVTGDSKALGIYTQAAGIAQQALTLGIANGSTAMRGALQGAALNAKPDVGIVDDDGLPILLIQPRQRIDGVDPFESIDGVLTVKLRGGELMIAKNERGRMVWVPLSQYDQALQASRNTTGRALIQGQAPRQQVAPGTPFYQIPRQ